MVHATVTGRQDMATDTPRDFFGRPDTSVVKKPTPRVKLVCLECGKKFSVSANAADPDCPKCGGVDWDVVG